MANKIECTINGVPNDQVFYVYYHAELQLDYDTFECYKDSDGNLTCEEFNPDSLTDNEPCFYYET